MQQLFGFNPFWRYTPGLNAAMCTTNNFPTFLPEDLFRRIRPATRHACRILLLVTTGDAVVVEDLEALCAELDVQCIE